MQPIPETGHHELVWTQPRARPPAYELYAGEDLVATLRWQKGSLAEARAAGCQWTFERGGFWHPCVSVREVGSDADLATFTTRWTGTGTWSAQGDAASSGPRGTSGTRNGRGKARMESRSCALKGSQRPNREDARARARWN